MSTQKKPQFLFAQLREKQDRFGNPYFIGTFGIGVTMTVFKHKTKSDTWNIFLSEKFHPRVARAVSQPKSSLAL